MTTFADELFEEMQTYGEVLYRVLIDKYPEFSWVEKYVLSGQADVVSELTGLLTCSKGLDFFWTYEASLNLYVGFISSGVPVMSIIRLKNGTKHTIVVVGVDEAKSLLYVHDPLGNYHTDYQDYDGANIPFSYELFHNIAVGNPLCLFCCSPPEMRSTCSYLLRNVKNFNFTAEEVQNAMKKLENTAIETAE